MLLMRVGRESEAASELLSIYSATKQLKTQEANIVLAGACIHVLPDRLDVAEEVLRQMLARPLDARSAAGFTAMLEEVLARKQK